LDAMGRGLGLGTLRVLLLPLALASLNAQSAGEEFFEQKIRPVLAEKCYLCHSSQIKTPMGALLLDTRSGVRQGGASGPVIVPGKPEDSLLLRALRYDSKLKMPPTGKLPDAVIADFEQWIAAGAPDPRADAAAAGNLSRRLVDEKEIAKGREWWAFQPFRELRAPRAGKWAPPKLIPSSLRGCPNGS
jgi:hypothetical protein